MADFSATNFTNAFQAPPSPLATVSNLVGVQNAMNENRFFQAKQVAGQMFSQSLDPSGNPDMGQFGAALKSDPRTASFAPQIMNEAAALRQTNIQNQALQYAVQTGQMDRAMGALGASYGQTPAQARQALHALVDAKVISPETAALPQFSTDEGIAEAQQRAIMAGGSPQESKALLGENQIESLGGTNQVVNIKTIPGQAPVATTATGNAAALENTLSPGEKAQPVNVIGPDGTPVQKRLSDFVTPTGEQKSGVSAPTVGFAPGVDTGFNTAAQGTAAQAIGLQSMASGVPARKGLLGNLEATLANFQPGPQSDFWKSYGQLAQEYHLPLPAPPADKVAAQEEFGKLAIQLAQSQFQALGGTGTDAQLSSTVHTSPNEFLSRIGNENIIGLLKGNEDAIAAQNDAWQKWQNADPVRHGPATFGRFQAQFNKIYDPRVFQSQYMSPDQRASMLKAMSPAEKTAFEARFKDAVKLGWVGGQ